MARGFTLINGYSGYKVCLPGNNLQAACTNAGGSYWDWSGQEGKYVCSFSTMTTDWVAATAPPCLVGDYGTDVLKPLSFSDANYLFAGIVVVVGLAWIMHLTVRQVLNR